MARRASVTYCERFGGKREWCRLNWLVLSGRASWLPVKGQTDEEMTEVLTLHDENSSS